MTDFPLPDDEGWVMMNRRRADLIRRSIEGTLSDDERAELERLQRQTLAALDESHPRDSQP